MLICSLHTVVALHPWCHVVPLGFKAQWLCRADDGRWTSWDCCQQDCVVPWKRLVVEGSRWASWLLTGALKLGSVSHSVTNFSVTLRPLNQTFQRRLLIACFAFFWKPNLSPRACFAEEHSCDWSQWDSCFEGTKHHIMLKILKNHGLDILRQAFLN